MLSQNKNAPAQVVHAKAACLIFESKFAEALECLHGMESMLPKTYFERAYCLYRLQKFQDALSVINSSNSESIRMKLLKAQVVCSAFQFMLFASRSSV